jgi:type IX secretion system substrate protein
MAQTNLVPNPSFEYTIQCPNFPQPIINNAVDWISWRGSVDLFNPCANTTSPDWGVPQNIGGYQNAHTGSGYAGVITWLNVGPGGFPYREFLGNKLTTPLVVGTKYYFSFFISNADSLSGYSSSNNFGILFSTQPYHYSAGHEAPINNFTHYHNDSIIRDKVNWTKMSGSFIADSAYGFIGLGNFYDDINTDIDTTITPVRNYTAYYYVDDVVVSTDSLYSATWTSVSEVHTDLNINIYPNPVDNWLVIENTHNVTEAVVYDMLGKEIIYALLNDGINKMDFSSIKNGIYFLVLDNKHSGKIIVQH